MDTGGIETLQNTSAVDVLSQTSTPVEVGEIELDTRGVVRPRAGDRPIRFDFVYQGVTFNAELPSDRDAELTLRAVAGVIPYSAENPVGRRVSLTLLASARLPRGDLWCDERMRLCLELRAVPQRPRTPVSVMATVVALLMDAKPYLDLLALARRRPKRILPPPRPAEQGEDDAVD